MGIDVTSRPFSKQIIFSGIYLYIFTVNSYHVNVVQWECGKNWDGGRGIQKNVCKNVVNGKQCPKYLYSAL
jgi:hypothetical protein